MKFRTMVSGMMLTLAVAFAACDSGNSTGVVVHANSGSGKNSQDGTKFVSVRFVNAVSGVSGGVLLTADGTAVGAAQTFGSVNTTCSTVAAGTRTLAIGTTTNGTTIDENLGTTLTGFVAGVKYTVIAAGPSENPTVLVLRSATIAASTGNANVRFVNVSGRTVDLFTTSNTPIATPTFASIPSNTSSSFVAIPTAGTTLTFRAADSNTALLSKSANFAAGQNYTVLLLPNATNTGFQTVTLPDC